MRLTSSFLALLLSSAALTPVMARTQERAEPVIVTGSRLGEGLPGASTTIITAEDIARDPGRSLPEILSRQAGIQVRSLNGRSRGATIDMRGFGEPGQQNTLILVNGRRLHDLDLAAVNLATIPLESVMRIEVLRGHAGAALYGDAAVGGAINIVLKEAAGRDGWSGQVSAGIGSSNRREGDISASFLHQGFGANLFLSGLSDEGWRENDDLIERAAAGELRLEREWGSLYAQFGADSMDQRLPGARAQGPRFGGGFDNDLIGNPRGSSTLNDWREEKGGRVTVGGVFGLDDDASLVIDGGFRRKEQRASFGAGAFTNTVDTDLDHWSFTPRLDLNWAFSSVGVETKTGFDLTHADYESIRAQRFNARPVHIYSGRQTNAAIYAQNSLALTDALTLGAGLRALGVWYDLNDRFDAAAPGAAFERQRIAANGRDIHWMGNLGLDYAVTDAWTVFTRAGRAVRLPNIDERIQTQSNVMNLATQTSWDVEGGAGYKTNVWSIESRLFAMWINDEIAFNPLVNFGVNLNYDPTQRLGWETEGRWRVHEDVTLKGNLSYVEASFRRGQFNGNDVPLVAPWTASAGLDWTAFEWLTLSTSLRYVDERRLANDQANRAAARTPEQFLWDAKISGSYEHIFWALTVNNILDDRYFDFGTISTFVDGRYNGNPLPGRTVLLQAGLRF